MAIQEDHGMILEAAAAGLESIQHLIRALSPSQGKPSDIREVTDFTVSRFKHVINIINRTGHARFRRAPPPTTTDDPQIRPLETSEPPAAKSKSACAEFSTTSQNSTTTTSFLSSITGGGDGSVSNGGQFSGLAPTAGKPPLPSYGKPPLAKRKRCEEEKKSHSSSSSCHCHRKRQNRPRKTIRVPAVSSKMSEIPQDEFSWRKYGQKPIKASPFPRGYYRCTIAKGCPAKKKVEQAKDDPTMLIVTYEYEHEHDQSSNPTAMVVGITR